MDQRCSDGRPCFFCGKHQGEDHFCAGCERFICDDCDERSMEIPFGSHEPEEHQDEDARF